LPPAAYQATLYRERHREQAHHVIVARRNKKPGHALQHGQLAAPRTLMLNGGWCRSGSSVRSCHSRQGDRERMHAFLKS
jgi:hypothetical protein